MNFEKVTSVFRKCDIKSVRMPHEIVSIIKRLKWQLVIQPLVTGAILFSMGYLACSSIRSAQRANDELKMIRSLHEKQDTILLEQYRWLRNDWFDLIRIRCELRGIKTSAIPALIDSESDGKSTALSPKGAKGLMQLMPDTIKCFPYVKDPYDPVQNITAGIDHFAYCLKLSNGNYALAFKKYNAGPRKSSNFREESIRLSMKCIRKMIMSEEIIIARM